MADKKDLSTLPQFLKPEVAERVAEHFKDGVLNKLRRMIAKNLEEM